MKSMHKKLHHLLIATIFLISSCTLYDHPDEELVITVGHLEITGEELKKDIKRMASELGISDQELGQLLKPLVDKIVNNYLILEYGRENGITISENELGLVLQDLKKEYPEDVFKEMLLHSYVDLDEWKEELHQQLLIQKILKTVSEGVTPVTFHEIKSYFDSHQKEFQRSQMVKFRQIITKTAEEAEKILGRIKKGEDLNELAMEYSMTTDNERDGEAGWIVQGQLDEAIDKVIFSLPVGKMSPVTKTPYGYHIFTVLDKHPEGLKSLPEVMEEIEKKLSRAKQESFYKKWLDELRGLFPVRINQKALISLAFG